MNGLIIFGLILSAIGVALFVMSGRAGKRAVLMTGTETKRIGEVSSLVDEIRAELPGGDGSGFSEFAELKGEVACPSPIVGELSRQPGAIVETSVQRVIETRRETRDSDGDVTVSWVKSHETLSSNRKESPWFLDDGTGQLRVSVQGAKLELEKVVDKFEPPGAVEPGAGQMTIGYGGLSFSLGGALSSHTADRRTVGYKFEERLLPVGRRLYAMGEIADTSDGLVLRKPSDEDRPYLLSLKSEDELVASSLSSARWMGIGAAALGVGGIALVVIGLLQ